MESQNRTGVAIFLGLLVGFVADMLLAATSYDPVSGSHNAPAIGGLPFSIWGLLAFGVGVALFSVGRKWDKVILIGAGAALMSATVWGMLFVFNPALSISF